VFAQQQQRGLLLIREQMKMWKASPTPPKEGLKARAQSFEMIVKYQGVGFLVD
jgi:hypothetical protein